MDLISIIMPAFNAEKFIKKSIESVINQTYENWELIIVDDGSIDRTSEICKKIAKTNNRIKIYSKNNEGVSNARNYGINKANGKYIMFLDADDTYKEIMIENMYNIMKNKNVDIVRANYCKVRNNKKIKNAEEFEGKKYISNEIEKIIIPSILKEKIHCYVWLLMIKKELLLEFNSDIHIFEDFNFYIEVLSKAKSLYMMNDELYYYNISNGNSLTKKNLENNIESMILAESIIKNTLKKYELNNEDNIKMLDTRIIINIINCIYHIQYRNNMKKAMKKYKEISKRNIIKNMKANYSKKYATKKENLFTEAILNKNYFEFYILCFIKNMKNKGKSLT